MRTNLIFDRILQDIEQKTQKGYYNLSDIERITGFCQQLASELGIVLTPISFVLGEKVSRSKMQIIIDNVNKIRQNWYVATDTPQTPNPINWDYKKANDLEKILQDLYDFLISTKIDKLYSGTFKAGKQIKFRGANL